MASPLRSPACLMLTLIAIAAFGCTREHDLAAKAAPPDAAAEEDGAEAPAAGAEGDDDMVWKVAQVVPPTDEAASALLGEVKRQLSSMKASAYSHHTEIDEAAGTFEYDCSGFLGYALVRAVPDALLSLQNKTVKRPLAKHFVSYIGAIPRGGNAGRWHHVARVKDLVPGDIVAWEHTPDARNRNTGHVMVVYGRVSADAKRPDTFIVPVIDSTGHPHRPGDSREEDHTTGLGTGSIELLVDEAGAPNGFRWSRGSQSSVHRAHVELARLR